MDSKALVNLKKQTLHTTLQRPVSLYPTTIGSLAAFYGLAFGFGTASTALTAVGLVLGAGGWAIEYFVRGDKHSLALVQRFRAELEQKRQATLLTLRKDLQSLDLSQGLRQLDLLRAKFDNFASVLSRKLNPEELAYNRYLTMAEQVYLNAIDNLEQLYTAQRSISAIDLKAIDQRLAELDANAPEADPLRDRRELWEKQQDRCKDLLLENEHAMTQLDHVTSRLGEVVTKAGRAQMDMDVAMSELKDLIVRADRYQRHG